MLDLKGYGLKGLSSVSKQIVISISQQTLTVFEHQRDVKRYSVSTGLKGAGCEKNSGKTPLGKHIIRAKIGDNMPLNSVFVGRRATSEIYSTELAQAQPDRDWILTRILWLSGQELGINRLGNVDTMQRYIYIHGTPDTEPMGKPLSHGCIRMRNQDLIELFDSIAPFTQVEITL